MIRKLIIIICCLFAVPGLAGQAEPPAGKNDAEVKKIIREIDEMYRSESSYSRFEMEIVTPHWQRTLNMDGWTIGMKKSFIRINEPKKDRGVATLRIENEMWNYLPKTNKVMKIPPSMMMGSWMGSDFTNDDLVKESSISEDYHKKMIREDSAVSTVELIPKDYAPIVWGRVVMEIDTEHYLPTRVYYYDEEDVLIRVIHYQELRRFDGKAYPSRWLVEPKTEDKEGHQTVLEIEDAQFDKEIDDAYFTKRALKRFSR